MTANDQNNQTSPQRKTRATGLRGHIASIIALAALAVVAVAWFWTSRQPAQDAGLVLPYGVIVAGGCAFVTALIAQIRNMDASDVLDMLGDLFVGLFAVIGAILLGIWNWFLGLLGLD